MISKLIYILLLYLSFTALIGGRTSPEPPVMLPRHSLGPYTKKGADSSIKIIRPTFFLYFRDRSTLRGKEFREIILRMVQVVNEARSKEYLYDSKHLDPWVESIVIIEEDNHWVVAFHFRGNGLIVRQAEGFYTFPVFLHRSPGLYYLSKNELELIEKPEGSLERTSRLTVTNGIEVSTNYPDDNVDSFMTIEEAMRRNREIGTADRVKDQ